MQQGSLAAGGDVELKSSSCAEAEVEAAVRAKGGHSEVGIIPTAAGRPSRELGELQRANKVAICPDPFWLDT